MDLQAAWFANHFMPQEQPEITTSGLQQAIMMSQLPAAGALPLAPVEPEPAPPAALWADLPVVHWWQDAAMTFDNIEPSNSASMGPAAAAPRQGCNALKVGQAGPEYQYKSPLLIAYRYRYCEK